MGGLRLAQRPCGERSTQRLHLSRRRQRCHRAQTLEHLPGGFRVAGGHGQQTRIRERLGVEGIRLQGALRRLPRPLMVPHAIESRRELIVRRGIVGEPIQQRAQLGDRFVALSA